MSCSVFLRINYELKMVVMLVAVVIYNVIILQTHAPLLDGYSTALYRTQSLDRYARTHTHTTQMYDMCLYSFMNEMIDRGA